MSLGVFRRELTIEPLTPPPPLEHSSQDVWKRTGTLPEAPDSIDLVAGWRAWRLHSTRFFDRTSVPIQSRRSIWGLQSIYSSLYDQHLWPFLNPVRGECIGGVKHEIPDRSCNCGVSAFHRVDELVSLAPTLLGSQLCVIGKVVGWGRVIVHEHGWRASHVYPISVGLICTHCRVEKHELKRARYVVYWGPEKKFTLALCFRHGNYLKRKGHVRSSALDLVPAHTVEGSLLKRYGVKPVGLFGLDYGYRVSTASETYSDTVWSQLVDGTHAPVRALTSDFHGTDSAQCGLHDFQCAFPTQSAEKGGN